MKMTFVIPVTNLLSDAEHPNVGVAYLATYIRSQGYDNTNVVDLAFDDPGCLDTMDADVYCLTATTPSFCRALALAQRLKSKTNTIIMGGPHVSVSSSEALHSGYVDYVVRGEGEHTLLKLLEVIKKGTSATEIRGISYLQDNQVVNNQAAPFIQDLDALPFPDYSLFPPLEKFSKNRVLKWQGRRTAVLLTSRGCPFNCYFCYKGISGRRWRARSPENVVAEWKHLIETYGADEIAIVDDCFNGDIKRAKTICQMVIDQNLAIPWFTPNGIRADRVDAELLDLMRRSGCYFVAYGVETGSPRVLKKIDKKISFAAIEKAFALSKQSGLVTAATMIIGHPWDDAASVKQTIDFTKRLQPDWVQYTAAMPIPGSRFYNMVEKEGVFLHSSWDDFDHYKSNAIFTLNTVTPEFIQKSMTRAYLSFYLSFGFLKKNLFSLFIYKLAYRFLVNWIKSNHRKRHKMVAKLPQRSSTIKSREVSSPM